mgnify:FL=1
MSSINRHQQCGCVWYSLVTEKKEKLYVRPIGAKKERRIRAGVILHSIKDDKFLLVETYHQHLGFPKGGQEKGESLADTASRELKEETGIEIPAKELDQLKRYSYGGGTTYFYYPFFNFPDQWNCLSIDPNPENDVTGNGWISFACFRDDPKNNSHLRKFVKEMMKKRAFSRNRR